MFDALLKATELAAKSVQWMLSRGDQKREKFASVCDRISEIMGSYAKAPEDTRLSRNLCSELRVYVGAIREIAEGVAKPTQLDDMAHELDRACEAWREHTAQVGHQSIGRDELGEIDGAAGHFHGLARTVRSS